MRVSNLLTAIASWLENPHNEAMTLAEYDEKSFKETFKACLAAAEVLRKGAAKVELIEPKFEELEINASAVDQLVELASAFDASEDVELKKLASVFDELLLTIAAPPGSVEQFKSAQRNRSEELKALYEGNKDKFDKVHKVLETKKAIEKSPVMKEYRVMEAPLSARNCPDHAGVQMSRVGEHRWQCSLDKKIYDYQSGYTTERGEKVPGGDVSLQNIDHFTDPSAAMFDSREMRLNSKN